MPNLSEIQSGANISQSNIRSIVYNTALTETEHELEFKPT